jgi:anion-transporting  ArsA/GET3 family ATPase
MKVSFIWGPGGVGKTHISLWKACQSTGLTTVFTLDPSRRIFDLLNISQETLKADAKISDHSFILHGLEASQLFENLSSRMTSNPQTKIFYDQMVKGLREFRDYLSLIQLSDELQRSDSKHLIIDTPPLQEAFGLHRAMVNLSAFFSQSLVQIGIKAAQKTSGTKWMHSTMKRLFEINQVFVGRKTADQIFEFLDWLSLHSERFKNAAEKLTDLVYSESTEHLFVVAPETSKSQLKDIDRLSKSFKHISFLMNRSLATENIPSRIDLFCEELRALKTSEEILTKNIQREFKGAEIIRIPFQLMGEDTREELEKFISSRTTKADVPPEI